MTSKTERQLVSVVFTDIEGYSALTQDNEALALSYVSKYREYVIRNTKTHHGEVIHFYGDGSLTIHDSAVNAVNCAIALQRDLRNDPVIPVRIGVHMGEIVRKDETVYGNAVNIASRIQDLGPAGSILVSESISNQIPNKSDIQLRYVGKERVKNISTPIKVFAVEHDGLIVPTSGDIHRRNKARKPAEFLAILAILAIILVSGALIFRDALLGSNLLPEPVREERVVVRKFENFTGDPSLEYISNNVTRHISRCLEEVESANVISYDALLLNNQHRRFGFVPLQQVLREIRAENVIQGSYMLTSDSTIKFTSGLRDGKTLEYIIHFPEVTSSIAEHTNAIEELGQRIAGYWQSKESKRLSIPLQDADNAFNEALRYWKKDYDKAIYYLKRAIRIDSSFMDAYYYLCDAYGNQWNYQLNQWDYIRADSVLQVIESIFNIEEFTERQLNNHHYYQAYIHGESENAFKSYKENYDQDPGEIFINTAMSILAIQFVNEPQLCLEILNEIPFDSIDFETNNHFLNRITMATHASIALGNYPDAVKFTAYYPPDIESSLHYEVMARALAGLQDTASIEALLHTVNLKLGEDAHSKVLYGLSRDFRRLGFENLSYLYASRALAAYENEQGIGYGLLLLDLEQIDRGLEHFQSLCRSYPDFQPYLVGLGRSFAMAGQHDEVKSIISKLEELQPDDFDFGATYYDECKLYTYIGEYDNALIKLQQAIDDGFLFTFRVVENDPDLLPLFDTPEFHKIIRPLAN